MPLITKRLKILRMKLKGFQEEQQALKGKKDELEDLETKLNQLESRILCELNGSPIVEGCSGAPGAGLKYKKLLKDKENLERIVENAREELKSIDRTFK